MRPSSASSSGVAGGGSGFVRSTIASLSTAVATTAGRPRYFVIRSGDTRAMARLSRPESNVALFPNTVTRRLGSIGCGRAGATTTVSASDPLSGFNTNATADNVPPADAVIATVSASGATDVDRICDSETADAASPSICTSRK